MNISVIILLLSLTVRDVFTIRGLHVAEVDILPEGQIPAESEDEVTCTISSIEPAGSDAKFVKYIASPEEASIGPCLFQDNSASTFEECADAAAGLDAKMFLFDEGRCRISDVIYDQTDQCSKNHSQMVYVDVEAATVPNSAQEEPFCNITRTTICKDGRLVNDLITNGEDCTDNNIVALVSFEGLYHLMASGRSLSIEEHYGECATHGALPCAPPDDASLSDFIDHLKELNAYVPYFNIGLNSSDSGSTFEWATGVAMPDTHVGWIDGQKPAPVTDKVCAYLAAGVIKPLLCQYGNRFCCMVPYFAD